MLVTAMYKETNIALGNFPPHPYIQDVIIIKEHKRCATMERISTGRDGDGTYRYATG